MGIVTVNLPVADIKAIENLVGKNGLYPSKSEVIRVALRAFLIKKLNMIETSPNSHNKKPEKKSEFLDPSEEGIVRIPTVIKNGSETLTEYKTYRIVQK